MKSQHAGTRGREGRKKKGSFFFGKKHGEKGRFGGTGGKITMRGVLRPPFMSPKESKHAQEGLKKNNNLKKKGYLNSFSCIRGEGTDVPLPGSCLVLLGGKLIFEVMLQWGIFRY